MSAAQLLEVTPRMVNGQSLNDFFKGRERMVGDGQVFAVDPPVDDARYIVAFVAEHPSGLRELIVWRADRSGRTVQDSRGHALVARTDADTVADGLAALGYTVIT